jgi:chromosome segregation ATPase
MDTAQSAEAVAEVSVQNVGGIDDTSVRFEPGVTILAGRNATNRTSLLQAIMAALGSERASLKGDADEGRVELRIGSDTYTRTLKRDPAGGVRFGGDPYLEDPEVADLFAFLLESNGARQAVERGDDLRELIMRPVDTASIESRIDELESERRRVDDRIEDLEELSRQLPDLESEKRRLEDQIEEKREELAEKEEEIENADRDVESTREEKRELDDTLQTLRDARSDLEDVRFRLESERDSVDALEEEREELAGELETLPEAPAGEARELQGRVDELRERKRSIDATVNELQTVIQFNEDVLEGSDGGVAAALRDDVDDDGAVTDQLVAEESVVCWTCGSEVSEDEISGTLDRLRELRRSKLDERRSVESQIDDLETERITYEEKQRQRDQLDRRLERTEEELDRREDRIEDLTDRREELSDRIEELEAKVEELQDETHSELLDLHKEANQLEFELGRLESDLEDVETELDEIDSRLDQKEDLQAERESINDELESLRTRIDDIERQAVEEFNTHIETVLGILEYGNLERVWIERRQQTVREGRRKVERSTFDLHVVRSTDDGSTYEDTVDHLSESEREVVGIVFGLAGSLVHDVDEVVPFLLLDSLEAIDSERIADLIDYVAEYADYTVVALLPEDAAAVDGDHQRVVEF